MTLEMEMKTQVLYDKVLFGLREQGHRSMSRNADSDSEQCAYRGDNNDKCAIGLLIPDAAYDPLIEGVSMYSITHEEDLKDVTSPKQRQKIQTLRNVLRESGIRDSQLPLLHCLQNAHDDFLKLSMTAFENKMIYLADVFSLQYTPPKDKE